MINTVNKFPISQLFDINSDIVFEIPKYQREYTWSLAQWEDLFDDIVDNEKGYFLGSIIAINQTLMPHGIQRLEVIDGQQRITTISLFLVALYKTIKSYDNKLDDEQRVELINLKRQLVLKKPANQTRVVPQIQNSNLADYIAKLSEVGIVDKVKVPKNAGNRKIFRAFKYFEDRILGYLEDTDNKVDAALEIFNKINSAVLVEIMVSSHSDAYTLFESLNKRGTPLTAIDLIKNTLLAKIDNGDKDNIEKCFEKWQELLDYIGDDYTLQERFFRHYYNAFKEELNKDFRTESNKNPLGILATRSNILKIYETLIKQNAQFFLEDILVAGSLYSHLLNNSKDEDKPYNDELLDLDRIQGSPSYLLLLYLMRNKDSLVYNDDLIKNTIKLITKFFVRRNLTDIPSTRDLTKIFMNLVADVKGKSGAEVFNIIRNKLIEVSASDDLFKEKLSGPIYEENTGTTRFILCYIEKQSMTREIHSDLWKLDDSKKYIWTIEHIFPQGENIPMDWVKMIGGGSPDKAKQHQAEFVHTIGNLTITGFNSVLGNKSFKEKRDRKDKAGRYVGYKNGLMLNEDLAKLDQWSIEQIKDRTEKLVGESIKLFEL